MSPSSVPDRPRPPIRGVIWHFTDLHFSPADPAIREDGKARPWGQSKFGVAAFDALLKYVEANEELRADFLVFSGDFVDATKLNGNGKKKSIGGDDEDRRRNRQAAFVNARKFVVDMAKAHRLDHMMHERVVVCPGNHDVDWVAALKAQGQSLTDYLANFSAFVGHNSDRPFSPPGTGGVCILALDTTPFGGAPFYDIARAPVQLDAGAYTPAHLDQALRVLKEEVGDGPACPHGVLGIVVSHHPPTVTPTPAVEVKPFEIAIGAGQAKYRLHSEGFRLFLTGHKHMAVVHQESLHLLAGNSAEGIVILTGAPFLAEEAGASRGFSVIEYAVSPESGDARVLVHPHEFDGHTPQPLPVRHFSVAPRRIPAGAVLRLTERISVSGDTRADFEYQGFPLPTGEDLAGWTVKDQKWVRQFIREESADQDTASGPLVAPLVPGVRTTANVAENLRTKANRRFHIQVEVDRSTALKSVSFVERVFNYGAFAVSKGHQRRVCGAQNVCPGVEPGWEGIVHLLREPVERLEFAIRLPFSLTRQYRVEVDTWTMNEAGEFVRASHLLRFSPYRVETNFQSKRISVTVDHPVVGVAYEVKWELPDNDPALGESGTTDASYEKAIQWAMRFQSMVLRVGTKEHAAIGEALREVVEGHIAELYKAGAAVPDDQVEWALFVPERKNDGPLTITAEGRPVLTPVFANFPSDGARWLNWPAGSGVVGRAFALNTEVEAIRPRSSRYIPPVHEEWINPPMPVYEKKHGSIDHSVLYGLPVHVPERGGDIVWGVLCIGTAREFSGLDLNKPLRPPRAQGAPPVPAMHTFMKSLTDVFSRKLARFMKTGTPFAEPLRGLKP